MRTRRKNPFRLSPQEQRWEQESERGEWKRLPKREEDRYKAELLEAAARRGKDARISLRLNEGDLALIRSRATREGIPYQTLIASILHKYATDQLVDESAIRKVLHRLSGARSERKRATG